MATDLAMPYSKKDALFLRKLGRRLRALRLERGWSQEEFSNQCELHRTYMGSIERGERNVAVINMRRIAKALGASLPEIFEGL